MENNIYNNIIEEYPNFRAFDLAVLHIYRDIEDKPFIINNNSISYAQEFSAISARSENLMTVTAFNKVKAKELLLSKINKGTKKYEEWHKYDFAISYEPAVNCRSKNVLNLLRKDFPEIDDVGGYFQKIFDVYKNMVDSKPVLRRKYRLL